MAMDVITAVASWRGKTEHEIVNTMTYPQFMHVSQAYFKDKMFVVSMVSRGLVGDEKSDKVSTTKIKRNKLPKWIRDKMRVGANVVDLDGPLEGLMSHVGGVGNLINKKR
jgi:hypothetical protein